MEARTTPLASRGHATWRAVATVVAAAAAVGVAVGFATHLLLARQSSGPAALRLPELHGQATWPAGTRPAPLFTLRNAVDGSTTSLASTHGRVTLIAFLDSRCKTLCPVIGRQLG